MMKNKLEAYITPLLSKFKNTSSAFQKRFGWMPLLLVALVILSFAIRYILFGFVTPDYQSFLKPWYNFIQTNGGFSALQYKFSDYNMPYLYLLALATYLPLKELVAIKLISITFDYILAGLSFFIIYKITKNNTKAIFAFFAVLFLPTVILNSALWGQCDAIYVSFIIMSIIALIMSRSGVACIFFGLALAFKLQAIFIAPLFLLLFLCHKINFRTLLWIPTVFLATLLPAIIIGKPIKETLLIYTQQASAYKLLTLNAANFYQWLPDTYFEILNKAGFIFAIAITLGFVTLLYARKKQTNLSPVEILLIATFFSLLVPSLLPAMHERYFFLADILALLLAIVRPHLWLIPTLIIATSFFSYLPYLFEYEPIPLEFLPFAIIASLILLIREMFFLKKS